MKTVRVPENMRAVFAKAEEVVSRFFSEPMSSHIAYRFWNLRPVLTGQ